MEKFSNLNVPSRINEMIGVKTDVQRQIFECSKRKSSDCETIQCVECIFDISNIDQFIEWEKLNKPT